MASVTKRISQITQPRGGYLNPADFKEIQFNDEYTLAEENIHPSIVGMAVDYMSRFMTNKRKGVDDFENAKNAFFIACQGYAIRIKLLGKNTHAEDIKNGVDLKTLINKIKGLDDASIIAACKLSSYDVWFRSTTAALASNGGSPVNPDKATIENIKTMVNRSLKFWDTYGPVLVDGFTFENDGYTDVVDSGDGDFLTSDTLWDFKVTKSKPTSKETLQLLMYWIMGQHSKKSEFKSIYKLGIYNPRQNVAYVYDVRNISKSIVSTIENEVICY